MLQQFGLVYPARRFVDLWIFPVWFAGNVLLAYAAWKLARCWFPRDFGLVTMMHTLVLCWAVIVVVAFLLGTAAILSGGTLLAGVSLVSGGILLTLRRIPAATAPAPPGEVLWAWLWWIVFALWFGHTLTSGLLKLPSDWDTLHYHLPIIVHWLQAGSLYAPDCCLWSSPGNSEIIGLWLVAPFSGDFLIGLNNLPVCILMACAAVEAGRSLGLSRGLAHLTAFALMANFVVLNQLLDASNDIGVAALFLACIVYGLRLLEDARPTNPDLLMFAAAWGLLAGIKFYALGYAALGAAAFFLVLLKGQGWRSAVRFAAVAGGGLFVLGAYWYLRNLWMTGSPLFPKSFDADTDLISRIYPDIGHTSFIGNARPELPGLAIAAVWHMAGPCHATALVAAPVVLFALLVSAWKVRRTPEIALRHCVLAFLLAGTLGLLLITPFAVEDEPGTLNQMHWHYCPVRYGMCFLSLAVLGFSLVLQTTCSRFVALSWFPSMFFLVTGLFQNLYPAARLPVELWETLIIAGNVLFLAGSLTLIARLWPRWQRPVMGMALLAMLLAGAWGVPRLADRWHRGFAPFYDRILSKGTYSALAERTPAVICVLDHRAYPFFGSRRQFRVCQPMYVPSSVWLLTYLQERDVRLVAIRLDRRGQGWHVFEHFDVCLAEDPRRFRRVPGEGQLAVFEDLEKDDPLR